jgi:hypothetical protein
MTKFRDLVVGCGLAMAMSAAALGQAGAGQKTAPGTVSDKTSPDRTAPTKNTADDSTSDRSVDHAEEGLVIEPAELPGTYPYGPYQVNLLARGNYVPTLHWTVEKGALPPGIVLDESGLLHGTAERAGEFQFVVTVRDGGKPQQAVQKAFAIKVVEAITVAWKVPAHVNVSRIEGSVEVSNTTVDDIDLTFDVKAVAENGRATEIGYQHFPLKRGTVAMTLPFGESLPHGAYLVLVDVTGEIAKRNAIYKEGLQMPVPLQVVPGP